MQSIADLALRALDKRAATSRAAEPVRRQSNKAGRCESTFWRKTNRQDVKSIVLAARKYELANKKPGARNGPLGTVALEVIELFANLVDFRSGRLDPSIDYMMSRLRRSRDAIVRALKALRAHGFLDWLRRYEPTNAETGPQVKQTSNAYRLSLPNRAKQLIARFFGTAPMPDDEAQERAHRVAVIEEHRVALDREDRIMFDFEDDRLAQSLARLSRAIGSKSIVSA